MTPDHFGGIFCLGKTTIATEDLTMIDRDVDRLQAAGIETFCSLSDP